MKEFWNTIQLAFAAVGGWLGYFLGGCDGLLYALLAFVVIDYITGVMCAIADKTLSSEVGFKGICRKVLIFLLVGIANVLDVQVIATSSVLRTAVIFFYISNEGVSLLENEDFEAAATLIEQRASEKGIKKGNAKYQQRYAFSSKIICGECGNTFRRRIHSSTYGKYPAWVCNTHLEDTSRCSMVNNS